MERLGQKAAITTLWLVRWTMTLTIMFLSSSKQGSMTRGGMALSTSNATDQRFAASWYDEF